MKKENKENLSKESMNDIENMTDENINEMEQDQELSEDISEADSAINKLESELSESKDKYLRLYSEFENFRRRTAREKLDLIDTATEGLMSALLPVLDDFERAMKLSNEESDDKSIREGMDLIYQKLRKTLEQKGLVNMNTRVGDAFDPDFHEAITQIPAPEEKLKGKIVDVIEKGYLIKEKVIRYAKVVTGS